MPRTTTKATLTSKGQFTIPKPIRDSLGLKAGMRVEVIQEGQSFHVRPLRKFDAARKLHGALKHLDDGRPTEEIIEEAIRRAAHEIRGSR